MLCSPCAGFTVNSQTLGVLVPNKQGKHVELYCYAYITDSLEHLIRFLDHIQNLLDEQILNEEFEGLGLEDTTELTTTLERLETIVAKKVEEALAQHMK